MKVYPVILNLKKKNCLVVGGGKIAERKIKVLLSAGAKVYLVSPKVTSWIKKNNKLIYKKRRFVPNDLDDKFLVIAATNDKMTNKKICKLADKKNILVNSINTRKHTNFMNMAVIRKNGLIIAISSKGMAVKKTMKMWKKIKAFL